MEAGQKAPEPNPLIPGKIVDGKLIVSNSLLKSVTCETRAYLTYVRNKTAPGEFAPMLAGSAVHAALAVWFRGGTRKEAMAALRHAYKEYAEANIDPEDKFLGRLAWENVRRLMRGWFDRNPIDSFTFSVNPELVEVPFATPLDASGNTILRGILDLLVRHKESGALYILDHKTTGRVDSFWLSQFQLESQLTGYIWGVRTQTDEPVVGGYVHAIELSKLPGMTQPTRKCQTHGVPYAECQLLHIKSDVLMVPRTREHIDQWRFTALGLAWKYRDILEASTAHAPTSLASLRMEGLFTGACRFCEFRDFCRMGRREDLIPTMLVDRPPQQVEYTI